MTRIDWPTVINQLFSGLVSFISAFVLLYIKVRLDREKAEKKRENEIEELKLERDNLFKLVMEQQKINKSEAIREELTKGVDNFDQEIQKLTTRKKILESPSISPILNILIVCLFAYGAVNAGLIVQPSFVLPVKQTLAPPFITSTLRMTLTPTPYYTLTPTSVIRRLEGFLTDRSGSPISGISISIQKGPETKTDVKGMFVLNGVPIGDQLLVVKSPSGKGQLTQNIHIESNKNTSVNIVYDSASDSIGLLSISTPAIGGLVQVSKDQPQRIIVQGRYDGLAQLFGGTANFEIWILVRSINDQRLWVQHPSAIIDHSNNTWQASAILGSTSIPPQDGEQWIVVAVASSVGSGIDNILNIPSISQLPPSISSNVVTIQTIGK